MRCGRKEHEVIEPLGQTSANSIAVTPNGLLGAPDPRTRGATAADNEASPGLPICLMGA